MTNTSNLFTRSEPHSSRERRIIVISAIFAGLLVLIDQTAKVLVDHSFKPGESIPVVKNFFSLTYVTNQGAAWGILNGYGWFLLTIAFLVMFAIIFFMRYLAEGFSERYLALMLIVSGITGNSIDRIWRGEVIDFLDLHIAGYHWPPVFNIADSAICVGVFIFFLSNLLRPSETPGKTPEKPETEAVSPGE
ncbi:MAG: signal peptidase II [Victivallales bacterium]|nr:signal peptidase II [Victivallales bacterium]